MLTHNLGSMATFVAEVTPPVGHSLQAGAGVKPVSRLIASNCD